MLPGAFSYTLSSATRCVLSIVCRLHGCHPDSLLIVDCRCGHCKRLASTWGELADFFADDDKIRIDHIDCTKQKDVCGKAQVRRLRHVFDDIDSNKRAEHD